MAEYRIIISSKAKKHLEKIYKSGKENDIAKIEKIFEELSHNPREGTGKPEKLKYFDEDVWSRRINQKDRLVYEIYDDEILVNIIRAIGHYKDK